MSMSTIFFVIVMIVIVSQARRSRRYVDERFDRYSDDQPSVRPSALADERRLESEVEELRDRVRVLERIVTDANAAENRHSQSIADEIERLRDKA